MIIARQSLQGLCPTLTFEDPAACAGTVREAVNKFFQDGVITYCRSLLIGLVFLTIQLTLICNHFSLRKNALFIYYS